MSVILQFTTDVPRRTRRAAAPEGPFGQILFFTGVRMERHQDDTATNRPDSDQAAKSRRRRKA